MPYQGYEDWDFWLAIVLAGWRCVVVPEALFYYRRRPGSMIMGSHVHGPELYRQIVERHRLFYQENCVEILVEKQKQISEIQALVASQDELIRERDHHLRNTEIELLQYAAQIAKDTFVIQKLAERASVRPDDLRLLQVEADIRHRLDALTRHSTTKPLPCAIFGVGSRGRLVFSCLAQDQFQWRCGSITGSLHMAPR